MFLFLFFSFSLVFDINDLSEGMAADAITERISEESSARPTNSPYTNTSLHVENPKETSITLHHISITEQPNGDDSSFTRNYHSQEHNSIKQWKSIVTP